MLTNPPLKNVNAFIDGQNLYHDVRESFGYTSLTMILYPFLLDKKGRG